MDLATWTASALILPNWIAWPLVKLFMAPRAMLNPLEPTSMARTLIFLPLKDNCQQVPQLAEFQPPMAGAPPMLGKWGRDPKVLKPICGKRE